MVMPQTQTSKTAVAEHEFTRESIELNGDGVVLPAMVYRPQLEGRRPAVLLAPGGLAQGTISSMDWLAARLARAGYLALTLTWRSNVPVEDDRDVALAIEWVRSDAGVDGHLVVMVGHSRGGNTTLRMAAQETRLRAVVALGPPCDLAHNFRAVQFYSPARYAALLAAGYPEPADDPELFALVSGMSYAAQIACPVLLVHGEGDMIAPARYSQEMHEALRKAGNDQARLELIPGMGHFFELTTQGYQFDRVATLITDWLGEVLGPRP
jgi:dipeptidyl aminopeptidase/acylaminoacyl peptidase